jgi:hypothetical protein
LWSSIGSGWIGIRGGGVFGWSSRTFVGIILAGGAPLLLVSFFVWIARLAFIGGLLFIILIYFTVTG